MARRAGGIAFWIAVVVGTALMGWGVYYYLDVTPDWERRIKFGVWLVGLDLVHDLVLLGAIWVAMVGWALVRRAPSDPVGQGAERLKNSWNSSSPTSATESTENPTGGSMA